MCAKLDLVPALISGKNKYLNKPALARVGGAAGLFGETIE
jgi:hypothetical protein